MKILSLEIIENSAGMVIIQGDKNNFEIPNSGKLLSIPKKSDLIQDILDFQTNFSMFLQNQSFDKVILCEGAIGSSRKRVRMEFSILSECVKQSIPYKTYPTGASTKLLKNNYYNINSGRTLADDLKEFGLPKYMSKAFVTGWKFMD